MREFAIASFRSIVPGLIVAGVASILDAYVLTLSWDHYFLIVTAGSFGHTAGQFARHPAKVLRDIRGRVPFLDL